MTTPEQYTLKSPFGIGDTNISIPQDNPSTTKINLVSGIPASYSAPSSQGGIKFTRHDMNGIGYIATQGSFLSQIGYQSTFNQKICDAIGGYPKGAILYLIKETKVELPSNIISDAKTLECSEVVSLQDNNTVDFTKSPDLIGKPYNGKIWWDYVKQPWEDVSFYPDYSAKQRIHDMAISQVAAHTTQVAMSTLMSKAGWINISFKNDSPSAYVFGETYRTRYAEVKFRHNSGNRQEYWNTVFSDTITNNFSPTISRLYPASVGDYCEINLVNNADSRWDVQFSVYYIAPIRVKND